MWIFTTIGFISAAQDKQDKNAIQIRCRSEQDIDAIQQAFYEAGHSVQSPRETPDADYRWRMVVPKDAFLALILHLGERVNYANFRHAAHEAGQGDKPLMRVWSIMAQYQEELAMERKFAHQAGPSRRREPDDREFDDILGMF